MGPTYAGSGVASGITTVCKQLNPTQTGQNALSMLHSSPPTSGMELDVQWYNETHLHIHIICPPTLPANCLNVTSGNSAPYWFKDTAA